MVNAVKGSTSMRAVLRKLGLKAAGGNYTQLNRRIQFLGLSTQHFKGRAWNKGIQTGPSYRIPIQDILVSGSGFQSYKLKRRLFELGLKTPKCELCGWAQMSEDGRVPVELDHINGAHNDNRIENLRILCPNCHSLQPTHRGKNIKKKL